MKNFKNVKSGNLVFSSSRERMGIVVCKGSFDELVDKGYYTDSDRETLVNFHGFTEEDLSECIVVNDLTPNPSMIHMYGDSISKVHC